MVFYRVHIVFGVFHEFHNSFHFNEESLRASHARDIDVVGVFLLVEEVVGVEDHGGGVGSFPHVGESLRDQAGSNGFSDFEERQNANEDVVGEIADVVLMIIVDLHHHHLDDI